MTARRELRTNNALVRLRGVQTLNRLPKIPSEWREEFEAAARRPLEQRLRYAFIKTYKPVLDDAPYRSWNSTAEYREWCERNLPSWLGYGRV